MYNTLKIRHFAFAIFLFLNLPCQTSAQDYFVEGRMKFTNWVYDDNIRSIKFTKEGNSLSEPIIAFNAGEKLELQFDDLSARLRSVWYSFVHCNALWEPTDMQVNEYLKGFEQMEILDYTYSRNTIQQYIHYQTLIPSNGMELTASGNYLLKVFIKGERDTLLFTRRLMIFEQLVSIEPEVRFATDLDSRNYYQEVRFNIDKSSFYIVDPYADLRVVIRQNGHWETAITTLKPRMVKGDLLVYDYDRGNYFSGGSEFRHLDIKSLKYYSSSVERNYRDAKGYHVELFPDQRRTFNVYRFEPDINGRMLITSEDVAFPMTESEYVWVEFELQYEAPVFHGGIYVFGEITGWEYVPEARMMYDFDRKAYVCSMLLKQGYYDYEYVFLENGARQADESFIEGRHSETENEYYLFAYYRGPGDRYDRLIGFAAINSSKRE